MREDNECLLEKQTLFFMSKNVSYVILKEQCVSFC